MSANFCEIMCPIKPAAYNKLNIELNSARIFPILGKSIF